MHFLTPLLSVLALTVTTVIAVKSDMDLFDEAGLSKFYDTIQFALDDSREKLAWLRAKAGTERTCDQYDERIDLAEANARDIAQNRSRWSMAKRKAFKNGGDTSQATAELDKLERKEGKVVVEARRIQSDLNKEVIVRRAFS